jgi:hypothetical protein
MFIKCILLTKKHNLPQKAMGSHSKSKQAVCGNIHMRSQANSWRKEKPEAEAEGKSIATPSKLHRGCLSGRKGNEEKKQKCSLRNVVSSDIWQARTHRVFRWTAPDQFVCV